MENIAFVILNNFSTIDRPLQEFEFLLYEQACRYLETYYKLSREDLEIAHGSKGDTSKDT